MKTTAVIKQGRVGIAYSGEILEDDILVGTFQQKSPKTGEWPLIVNFYTSFAEARFQQLAGDLTIQATLKNMIRDNRISNAMMVSLGL